MAEKKAPLNPKFDELIRTVVKDEGYKLAKKETKPAEGIYCIEIEEEPYQFVIYMYPSTEEEENIVQFCIIADDLAARAERIGMYDILEFYLKISDAVPEYSFALRTDEDGHAFTEFRFTIPYCIDKETLMGGISMCLDASYAYIDGIENGVGLKY